MVWIDLQLLSSVTDVGKDIRDDSFALIKVLLVGSTNEPLGTSEKIGDYSPLSFLRWMER